MSKRIYKFRIIFTGMIGPSTIQKNRFSSTVFKVASEPARFACLFGSLKKIDYTVTGKSERKFHMYFVAIIFKVGLLISLQLTSDW